MSGTLLTICPPTLFDFTNLLLNVNAIVNIPVAMRVDLSQYESAILQVRVHTLTITTPDTIDIVVSSDGYTPDDPGIDFSANNLGTQLAILQVQSTTGSPDFIATNLSTSLGGIVKVSVRGVRNQVNIAALSAKLSIDLAVKTGAEAGPFMARRPGTFMGYMPDLSGR